MSNARTDYSLESLAASSATTLASAENTSPRPNLRGHLPVLDGVRGLAILMVLLLVEIRLNAKNQLTAAMTRLPRSAQIEIQRGMLQ
jgi:hypothetical protein